MNRPLSNHLSDEEFEALLVWLERGSHRGDRQPSGPADEVRLHAADCQECREKLRILREGQDRLTDLKLQQPEGSTPQCTAVIDWTAVVAGILSPEQAQNHLQHAAQCSHCGPLLKNALADFFIEPTLEEAAILDASGLNRAENQLRLAQKLHKENAGARAGKGKPFWTTLFTAPSISLAAVLLVVVSGFLAISRRQSLRAHPATSPLDLVAIAYTERRTSDLRINGANYSRKVVERGAGASSVDRPLPLQRAAVLIHEGLLQNPDDPDLLQAKGRVDLLDGSGSEAIDSLQRALKIRPESTSIRTDLATAFYTRGENSRADEKESGKDYLRALDELGTVLAKSPRDSVALFNRALVEDRLQMYGQEVEDWKTFLGIERDPGWHGEGNERLEEALKRIDNQKRSSGYHPPPPSAALVGIKARTHRAMTDHFEDPLDEVLLSEGITEWLPSAARSNQNDVAINSSDESTALAALALEMRIRHRDPWLSDLLVGSASAEWHSAATELNQAARANAEGRISDIVVHSLRAAKLFQKLNNPAGVAAARFEYLVGLNRSVQADLCRQAALDAIAQTASHRYIWLRSNALFESATCNFMIGRQEAALQDARQASVLGRRFHYKTVELLGAYFLDGVATTSVAASDSWGRIEAGLTEFWSAAYPPETGEGFYSDLGYAAQNEGLWHGAERAFQEALLVYLADGNEFSTASARERLAEAAEAAGDDTVANAQYREADRVLKLLGNGASLARIEFAIERANIETTQGKLDLASTHLGLIRKELSEVTNHYALVPYFESAGNLHLLTGQAHRAEEELLQAIALIEEDKSTLQTDTDRLTWHRNMAAAYRLLLQVYALQYRDDRKTFALLEWYRAGPVRAVASLRSQSKTRRREVITNSELAQFLPENLKKHSDAAVLTWIVFPDRIAIFLLNEGGLHTATSTVLATDFDNVARGLLRQCSDPSSNRHALDRSARLLYQWLVQPVVAHLSVARTIELEPDDSFPPIPFELLEDQRGDYLGDNFDIAESPGIAYAQLLRTGTRISAASAALVVGEPTIRNAALASRFPSLPEAANEAVDVSSRFNHHFLLIGSRANATALVHLLPRAELFHFAGHAVSQGNEMGLLLASNDGSRNNVVLLSQKELRNREMRDLKLVILSGCKTANSEWGLTDPQSLVRTFLRAGVPNIVASRWQVDSAASAELMNHLYTRLLLGDSIPTALAAARYSLRSQPNTSHPYYWAAFSVFGR